MLGQLKACLVLSSLVLCTACISKDTMFFGTKTSIGIDIGAKPPTFDLAFSRRELSIGPTIVKAGEPVNTIPVMAGFTSDSTFSNNVFGAGASTQFAVGKPAAILTKFAGSDASVPHDNAALLADMMDLKTGSVAGTIGDRRYYFGTDTCLGFKVDFAAESGYLPDSIALGWRRRELAIAPIDAFKAPDQDLKPGEVAALPMPRQAVPSMLATSQWSTTAAAGSAGARFTQFYATGTAADWFTTIPGIRNALIEQINGSPEVADAAKEQRRVEAANQQFGLVEKSGDLLLAKATILITDLVPEKLARARIEMIASQLIDEKDEFPPDSTTEGANVKAKRDFLIRYSKVGNDAAEVKMLEDFVGRLEKLNKPE